jgi:DNA-binding transcriptional regulator YiaG
MTMHAYQEIYVSSTQSLLGEAFDYAINVCKLVPQNFVKIFVTSQISKRIEIGDPKYVKGMSGIELVIELLKEATGKYPEIEAQERYFRSPEYWLGWALAYYQWTSDRTFSEIFDAIPFDTLIVLYPPLHEADISKFVEVVDSTIRNFYSETNLKRIRKSRGLSQNELSNLSGVGLRSIQLYEQRRKDINKAQVETLYNLAKILCCNIENLLEK